MQHSAFQKCVTGVVLAAALALCAHNRAFGQANVATVRNAGERTVAVRDTRRIVSIGGAVTETLYALGQEQRIVGVDSTSVFPPSALRDKPNVGYMRQLSPEGLLGLNPTLILAAEGAGPKQTIAVLEAASVPLVLMPDHFSREGVVEKIQQISSAVGLTERGRCLAKHVQADLDELAQLRTKIDKPARIMFLLSFLNGKAQVGGRATAADGMIQLAGATNAITDYEGYKPINDEAVVAASPDFVIAMHRPGFRLDARTVFAHPGFALTPAAKRGAFLSMEGHYLLSFGPRTALAARDLATAIYSELGVDRLSSESGASGEACSG